MVKNHPGGQRDSSASHPTDKAPPIGPSSSLHRATGNFTNQPPQPTPPHHDGCQRPHHSDCPHVGSRTQNNARCFRVGHKAVFTAQLKKRRSYCHLQGRNRADGHQMPWPLGISYMLVLCDYLVWVLNPCCLNSSKLFVWHGLPVKSIGHTYPTLHINNPWTGC